MIGTDRLRRRESIGAADSSTVRDELPYAERSRTGWESMSTDASAIGPHLRGDRRQVEDNQAATQK